MNLEMIKQNMQQKYIIWSHIIFWIFFLILPLLPLIFPDRALNKTAYLYYSLETLLNVVNFYICYFATNQEVFDKNKVVKNSVKFMVFNAIFAGVRIGSTVGIYYIFGVEMNKVHITFNAFLTEFLITIGYSLVPVTMKFTFDWLKDQQLKAEMVNNNHASEIALLRSQINPHFLFNTLNNIYSLVYKKSDDAPAAVMKLSEIMRYMLYEANSDKVLLEREVEYLKSFIELQLLRTKDGGFIEFLIEGDISGRLVAPMLLIPFIENAVKHGAKKCPSPGIKIFIKCEKQKLIYNVMNYVGSEGVFKDSVGGIGLQNVKRRLELIYPNKHDLKIVSSEDRFIVELIIEE